MFAKARGRRQERVHRPLAVEMPESRHLLSRLIRVAPSDPFAGNPADDVAGQPGTNYPGSQVEPFVAANPTRGNNLVGIWQQDRWSNGGARGLAVGVSMNRGNKWTPVVLPGVSLASGGSYQRASDPWLSFSPNGVLYATALAFNTSTSSPFGNSRSAILVSRSTDGGRTWGAPTTLIDSQDPLIENVKETITADPTNPNFAYVVWDQLSLVPPDQGPAFQGPTLFSRTTDGGQHWEPARVIYNPGPDTQTIGNQIVVLPNGTLVDVFVQGSPGGLSGSVELVRSTDHGEKWSSPVVVATGTVLDVTDLDKPDASVRTASELPEVTTDPATGAIYLVLQSVSFTDGPMINGITFLRGSMSKDGELDWSAPIKINRTPTDIPAADQQAFDPMIRVAADGTVAVTYYDFSNNTSASGVPTDAWAVFANPKDPKNLPGGLTNPANWGHEVQLTNKSFDIEEAPNTTEPPTPGYFVGDYEGLTAVGSQFLAFFSQAGTNASDTASIFSRRFHPNRQG